MDRKDNLHLKQLIKCLFCIFAAFGICHRFFCEQNLCRELSVFVKQLSYGNFGDNDTLAAYVSRLVDADLLILMSDIDGLYTDDPRKNPNARFIHTVGKIGRGLENMAKGASSDCGTSVYSPSISDIRIRRSASTSRDTYAASVSLSPKFP